MDDHVKYENGISTDIKENEFCKIVQKSGYALDAVFHGNPGTNSVAYVWHNTVGNGNQEWKLSGSCIDVNNSANNGSTGTTACDFRGATLTNVTINGCNIQISGNSRINQLSYGQKVDVNLYDCIDKALDASCSLIPGKVGRASCALDLLNKNTGNAAELIIEQIPIINKIDDVADFFVGDAIDTVCSGAQSIVFSGAALAFATLLLVFE
jgi:hypothetical protein